MFVVCRVPATEFARWATEEPGHVGGRVPHVDTELAVRLYQAMTQATSEGILRSSHTPTLGGLAVGFSFCALAGDLGAVIDLAAVPSDEKLSDDAVLFSESHSRFVVTCRPEDEGRLQELFAGLPMAKVGTVLDEPNLTVTGVRGRGVIHSTLPSLRKAFKETLHGI